MRLTGYFGVEFDKRLFAPIPDFRRLKICKVAVYPYNMIR